MSALNNLIIFYNLSSLNKNEIEKITKYLIKNDHRIIILDDNINFLVESTYNFFNDGNLKNIFHFKISEKRSIYDILNEVNSKATLIYLKEKLQTFKLQDNFQNIDFLPFDKFNTKNYSNYIEKLNIKKLNENNQPKIGVLTIQNNAYQVTKQCIEDIKKTKYSNLEIYLLENESTDLSGLKLFLQFKQLTIITLQARSVYCFNFNILAEYASYQNCEYLFILNNDTKNFSDNLFFNMIEAFSDPNIGIVSPKVYDFDGNKIHWRPRKWLNIPFDLATEGYMTTTNIWKKVNGFTNDIHICCEDLDLLFKIRQLGLKEKLIEQSSFYHLTSASMNSHIFLPFFFLLRNTIWIQKKYFSNLKFIYIINSIKKTLPVFKKKLLPISFKTPFLFILLCIYFAWGLAEGIMRNTKPNILNETKKQILNKRRKFILKLK